jgi:hypothetical protein
VELEEGPRLPVQGLLIFRPAELWGSGLAGGQLGDGIGMERQPEPAPLLAHIQANSSIQPAAVIAFTCSCFTSTAPSAAAAAAAGRPLPLLAL